MKKMIFILAVVFSLGLMGCSKDAEINAFMKDLEGVSNEMVQKIDAGDIDGAQSAFDAKKAGIKASFEGIKTARGFQVSEATKKSAEESMVKNGNAIREAVTRNAMKFATDKAKMEKLQALLKEFQSIFTS